LTYEATQILLQAVELAGSSEPARIKEAIQNIKGFPALTGRFSFDQDGSPVKPAVIIQVRDGRQVYAADISL
jgi:branched-chain amino acid transport system substrate-binding protein